MTTPLLSVFIPAYNAAPFIRQALESVLDNGYGDMEVIVVDDASTDGTCDVVAAIRHPAVRLVRNPVNLGVAATRRAGVALLRGVHLALLERMTDENAFFERWRSADGGALDVQIMSLFA